MTENKWKEKGLKNWQMYKHGYKYTPTYTSWRTMKGRCLQKSHKSYQSYGGSGITICERWMEFIPFLEDMGERPEGNFLDRIDNSKGYYKENCRWVTPRESAKNRSSTKLITHDGQTLSLAEWARKLNVEPIWLGYRLRHGRTMSDILILTKTPDV